MNKKSTIINMNAEQVNSNHQPRQVRRPDERNRRLKRFHSGWFFAFLVPLLLVAGLLFVFSKFLYGVEYYSPSVELEKYVQYLEAKDYKSVIDYLGLKTTPFNGINEYTTYFEHYYGDKIDQHVFVERKLQETDTSVFYDVSINKKASQKFKLTKIGPKKLFWFHNWEASFVDTIPVKTIVIHTVPGVTLHLNGNAILSDYLVKNSDYIINSFRAIKDDKKNVITESYQVEGVVAVSSLQAVDGNGEECEVTLKSDKDTVLTYQIRRPIPKDQIEGLKTLALDMTKKYTEFIAYDAGFSNLQPYLYKNSTYYSNLQEFYPGWFTPHQSYGFENIKYFGTEWFDETHCKVGISLDYHVVKKGIRHDYAIKHNVYLVKVESKWLIAEFSINEID